VSLHDLVKYLAPFKPSIFYHRIYCRIIENVDDADITYNNCAVSESATWVIWTNNDSVYADSYPAVPDEDVWSYSG